MSIYEIIVFENQNIYDREVIDDQPRDNIVNTFVEYCKRYLSPEYIFQNETELYKGTLFISYTDRSGGDKPCNIMLLGSNLTNEMYEAIRCKLDNLYLEISNRCDNCGEIVLNPSHFCRGD